MREEKRNTIKENTSAGKKPTTGQSRRSAYGGATTICMNGTCALRKKSGCSGFEACPGFKGR